MHACLHVLAILSPLTYIVKAISITYLMCILFHVLEHIVICIEQAEAVLVHYNDTAHSKVLHSKDDTCVTYRLN